MQLPAHHSLRGGLWSWGASPREKATLICDNQCPFTLSTSKKKKSISSGCFQPIQAGAWWEAAERRSGTHQTHFSSNCTLWGLLSAGSAHPLQFLRWTCGTRSALCDTTLPFGLQLITSRLTWSRSRATTSKASQPSRRPRWDTRAKGKNPPCAACWYFWFRFLIKWSTAHNQVTTYCSAKVTLP